MSGLVEGSSVSPDFSPLHFGTIPAQSQDIKPARPSSTVSLISAGSTTTVATAARTVSRRVDNFRKRHKQEPAFGTGIPNAANVAIHLASAIRKCSSETIAEHQARKKYQVRLL